MSVLDSFSSELTKTVGTDAESGLQMLIEEGIGRVCLLYRFLI
jgi:hypothetical protein